MTDFWIFGYGSLIWKPGFDYARAEKARLPGFHRAPCIYSIQHRGTRERPGIVLGLIPGGECHGMAFQARAGEKEKVRAYLRKREMINRVYREEERKVKLEGGEEVSALVYRTDTNHDQYVGRERASDISFLLPLIRGAKGLSGRNEDYMLETVRKLKSLGIRDNLLERIAAQLEASTRKGTAG